MFDEKVVLCGANFYEQKYYLNPDFDKLPELIQQELKILCVLFTEEVGGILTLSFDVEGTLCFEAICEEEDILYDEIGSGLKIKQLQLEKQELLESLELYYNTVIKNK